MNMIHIFILSGLSPKSLFARYSFILYGSKQGSCLQVVQKTLLPSPCNIPMDYPYRLSQNGLSCWSLVIRVRKLKKLGFIQSGFTGKLT